MRHLITRISHQLKAQYGKEFLDAIYQNDTKVIDKFLSQGISVNYLFDKSFTPLWSAVMYNEVNMVEKLLNAGANPNLGSKSKNSNLPLDVILGKFSEDKSILSGPTRLRSDTPEDIAAEELKKKELKEKSLKNSCEILVLLLKFGANIEKKQDKLEQLRRDNPYLDKLMLKEEMPQKIPGATPGNTHSFKPRSNKI